MFDPSPPATRHRGSTVQRHLAGNELVELYLGKTLIRGGIVEESIKPRWGQFSRSWRHPSGLGQSNPPSARKRMRLFQNGSQTGATFRTPIAAVVLTHCPTDVWRHFAVADAQARGLHLTRRQLLFMHPSNRATTRGASILVIDDNELNRDALSCLLRLHHYEVEIAAGGHEALALVESNNFDLVLLDVQMPGLSGLDVLTQIRPREPDGPARHHGHGRTHGPDIVEAFDSRGKRLLTKPIVPRGAGADRHPLSHKAWLKACAKAGTLHVAVNGANDGLWDWNLATNEVYWSPRWKSMLGYEDSEIAVTPDEWLDRLHQDDWTRVRQSVAAHIAHGNGHFESEHRLRHRDGTFRWVLCRAAAIRNQAGRATRFAGSLTDITSQARDGLTGLPNRVVLDLLERAINRTVRGVTTSLRW